MAKPPKKSKSSARKAGKTSRPKAKKAKANPASPSQRNVTPGFISHTEFASSDPAATKTWASAVFGWKFDTMPMPDGSTYHMWASNKTLTGGGIRANTAMESPGAVPYVEVADIKKAYAKALAAGASEMLPPQAIPGSGGWIAMVKAPGGPTVGMWGRK